MKLGLIVLVGSLTIAANSFAATYCSMDVHSARVVGSGKATMYANPYCNGQMQKQVSVEITGESSQAVSQLLSEVSTRFNANEMNCSGDSWEKSCTFKLAE